ncbi:hypothetical protein [Sulfolobus acidocaldarius]|nr:hypothetical protein [Sulfolobus acidocaldarius]AHC51105.1 hypothetical protein SUSAZ_03320 [Sulfolobus acidocaldarius SUSAZ]
MKSFLGSTILQISGVIGYAKDYEEAKILTEKFKGIFKDLSVKMLDLSKIEDRLLAINLDPDIGDFKEGYVIAIGI